MLFSGQVVRVLLVCFLAWHCSQHTHVVSSISFPSRGFPSPRSPPILTSNISPVMFLKDLRNSVEQGLEKTWADLPLYRERFPSAFKKSLVAGSNSFINSLRVLFPVALVLSIGPSYPDWKMIMKNGVLTGLQWSAYSGVFSSGETLAERLRETKDRLNPCFGSGLSGAAAQFRQGSLGMAQGFMSGVAFYYVIDKFMGGKDPFIAVSSSSSLRKPSKSSSTTKSSFNRKAFPFSPTATLKNPVSATPNKPVVTSKANTKPRKANARPISKPSNMKKPLKASLNLK